MKSIFCGIFTLWNATRARHVYIVMLRLRYYFFTLTVSLHRVAHSRTDHTVIHAPPPFYCRLSWPKPASLSFSIFHSLKRSSSSIDICVSHTWLNFLSIDDCWIGLREERDRVDWFLLYVPILSLCWRRSALGSKRSFLYILY